MHSSFSAPPALVISPMERRENVRATKGETLANDQSDPLVF